MEKLDIFSEDFNFNDFQKEAIGKLKAGQSLTGKDGILTPLIKQLIEASLEVELDAHLNECKDEGMLNRRNGKLSKTVKTGAGSFELETSRDRAGTFEPQLIKKNKPY